MTGLATGVVMLTIARSGSSLGKAVIDPTHNSLLADYYPIEARSKVFSTHRAANAVGAFVGPLSAGLLAYAFGWRVPFLVFVVPTIIFAVLALKLHEPVRGKWERAGDGCQRRGRQHRGDGAVVRGELAHRPEDPHPAAAVVEPAVPGHRADRVRGAGLADVRAAVQPRRAWLAASPRPSPSRSSWLGLVIGTRYITKRFMADMRGLIRFIARVAILHVGRVGRLRAWRPTSSLRSRINCVISGDARGRRAGHSGGAVARDSRPRSGHRLLGGIAVGHSGPARSCR